MSETLPKAAREAAKKDRRIVQLVTYPDGWVSNSYRYRAPGQRTIWERKPGNGHWHTVRFEDIDRKRAHGQGPRWAGLSEKGGRLAVGY